METNNKIIEFPKTEFENEIDLLVKLFHEKKVHNLVLAYTITEPEKPEPNHFATYWFGKDTCLYMLGLVKKLDERILDFMRENKF